VNKKKMLFQLLAIKKKDLVISKKKLWFTRGRRKTGSDGTYASGFHAF